MRVKCLANRGIALLPGNLHGNTTESIFHVVVGKEYLVFAMAIWMTHVSVLLSDENHLPNWYPLELFSVADPRLPNDWLFAEDLRNEYGLQAVWGYERLVQEPSHYDALLERIPEELKYFYIEEQRRQNEYGVPLPPPNGPFSHESL